MTTFGSPDKDDELEFTVQPDTFNNTDRLAPVDQESFRNNRIANNQRQAS